MKLARRETSLDKAATRQALARAEDVAEVKAIRDALAAARDFFRKRRGQQGKATTAALLMLEADRRGGELLAGGLKAKGNTEIGSGRTKRVSAVDSGNRASTYRDLDIDKTWASLAQRLYGIPEADFQAEIRRWENDGTTLHVPSLRAFLALVDVLRQRERTAQRRKAAKGLPLAEQIIVGDFREHADAVPDGSLSLIFTDPPYLRGDEEVFPGLADFAARKLASGGSILFYIGHLQLPAAFKAFDGKLRHWWTCACVHAGGKALMREYGIRVGWKPILWFVKETREDRLTNIVFDTVSGETEKDHHPWQQSENEALYWIEALCPKDGTVCDPFLGGGTTGAAAKRAGRKWIGFEIDPDTASVASKRVAG